MGGGGEEKEQCHKPESTVKILVSFHFAFFMLLVKTMRLYFVPRFKLIHQKHFLNWLTSLCKRILTFIFSTYKVFHTTFKSIYCMP